MFSFFGLQDQGILYTTKTLHLRRRFSIMPEIGIRTRRMEKYRMEASWPMVMKGCSTGWPPIHVRARRSATRNQNKHWLNGRNIIPRCLEVWRAGITAKIRMDRTRAKTPPSLLGMDRRIAYANRKYHSGLI